MMPPNVTMLYAGNLCVSAPNNGNEANNEDAVDRPEPANRSAFAQFADAELRIDIIHLHEDQLQERDQDEERQEPVNPGLPEQSSENPD